MAERRYLDFDLVIEREGELFRARVVQSPTGSATVAFQRPFADMEIENFVLKMGRKRGVRRKNSPEMDSAKEFGTKLFDAVFAGDVEQCLEKSLRQARQQDLGLRITLTMKGAQELTDLPWEYLYNSSENHFMALSNETPLVRFIEMPQFIPPLAVKPPIRMLVMISSPSDCAPLDVDQEKVKLDGALGELQKKGLVEVDILPAATLATLQDQLREKEYHIFHFIGHGGFDKQNEEGILLFEEEDKKGREVGAQILAPLLRDERTLRLAVLNACEGARSSNRDPFSGTAQTLVQQGIPAVIAMQFDVSDQAAIAFTQEFYKAIAIGYPVDAALAEGRKAIFAQVNEVEWGTPVLYTRTRDGNVFDVTRVDQRDVQSIQITSLLREAEQELAAENWGKGVEKLQAALVVDPNNAQIRARLAQATQQLELARLYAKGRTAYDAGHAEEALGFFRQIQNIKRDYKGIEPLIKTIERDLVLNREEEQKRQRVAALFQEADQARSAGNWPLEIQKLEALLKIEPSNAAAATRLAETRQKLELATIYNRGVKYLDSGRFSEALVDLRRVREMGANYRDLPRQIAYAEEQVNRITVVPERPSFFSSMKLVSVGGCIGVVAVVAIVIAIIALLVLNNTTSTPKTYTPSESSNSSEPSTNSEPSTTKESAAPVEEQQPKYSNICVAGPVRCALQQQAPVGTDCYCANLENGQYYTGKIQ